MNSSLLSTPSSCAQCGHHSVEDTSIISPVPYLLKTNNAPIASEIPAIHNAISKAEFDLSHRDRQISHAVALLNDLQYKRTQDEQHLKMIKGIMHPVRRIPPEILAEIFILTLPKQWQLVFKSGHRQAVLLPGQVCRIWRDISLTTPQLWSRISMHIGLQGKSLQVEVDMVDIWLSRAGQYPLAIEIFRAENFQLMWYMPKPLISKALIESCCRWRYLRLSGSWSWLYSGALEGVRNRLSHLQDLVYDQTQNDASSLHSRGPITLFEKTPQLRYHRCRSKVHPWPFNLPWAQLTGFSAENISLQDCHDILSRAQNLVTFSVSTMRQSLTNSPLHPVHHPRIRSLCIAKHLNSGTLLNYLTLPALLELRYTEVSVKSLLDFLSRSTCSLQTLALGLSSIAVSSGHGAQILRLLPSLSQLQLTHHATDRLLSDLSCASDSEILVPKLHTIELTIGDGKKPCPRLANMIESRWRFSNAGSQSTQYQITPLKHVRISMKPNAINTFDSKTHIRLRRLRDEGLNIYFTDKDGATVEI